MAVGKRGRVPTLADKMHKQVVAKPIRPLIEKQIDNYRSAKATGTTTDLPPWQSMIGNGLAKAREKFSITKHERS